MEDCYGVVYKMTNRVNGMVYIGQTTKSLKERLRQHFKFANRKDRESEKTLLYRDIRKDGEVAFDIKMLCECFDKKDLDSREIFYIKRYKKLLGPKCYNIRIGLPLSEETKRKISESKMGGKAWNKGKECPQLAGKNNGMYGQYGKQKTSKEVMCKDLKDKEIKTFVSVGAAVQWLKEQGFEKANHSPLSAACRGVRKTMYGYKWSYA